jgi:TonB family protein
LKAEVALANPLLINSPVRTSLFDDTTAVLPKRNRVPLVIAGALHLVLLGSLLYVKTKPVRVNPEGAPSGGIAAYVSGPVGGTPAAAPRSEPRKTALKTEAAKTAPKDDQSAGGNAVGTAGVAGGGQAGGGGPVRLGSGGNVTLLKKVQPIYPTAFQMARMPGQVMLDAVIHADGTIGDITVLRSTNDAFARSAVEAVKQWKYAPIGFEAILTVTVNFTMA